MHDRIQEIICRTLIRFQSVFKESGNFIAVTVNRQCHMLCMEPVVAAVKILSVIQGQHKPQVQHKRRQEHKHNDRHGLPLCFPEIGTGKKIIFSHIYHPISARKEASFSCLSPSSGFAFPWGYLPRSHSPRIMPSFKYRIRLPLRAERISCVTMTILCPISLNLVSVSSTSSPVLELRESPGC